jgi:tetratricopeptide (TPR) repeat protein/SAM-dependent methyltransferase
VSFSIRKLFKRGGADVAAPGGDRRLAQELVDRGIAAETSGTAAEVLQCYRGAVAADDNFAPAHMNLGIALHAAGDFAAAIESYDRSIALDPEYAGAHYNLALTYLSLSKYADAETGFATALRLRDDFPEAWVGLADALEALGRDEDAMSALDKAIALRGDYVGALMNSSALLQKLGRLKKAIENTRRVLVLEPDNYLAQFWLGTSQQGLGRLTDAETSYRHALVLQPDYPDAKTNLAMVLQAQGRIQEALPLLFDAVANAPSDAKLRRMLVQALHDVGLNKAGSKERSILLSLCMDANVSMLFLNTAIIELTKSSEGFQILQRSARRDEDPFTSVVPAVAAFLGEPLLLAALPRMPIPDIAMEEVLAHLRRRILVRFERVSGLAAGDSHVPAEFTCALARQCFFSGYAFFAGEDELMRVARLRDALQNRLRAPMGNARTLESSLSVAALYGSLHTFTGHDRLLDYPIEEWSDAFRPIIQEQLENRRREHEIARHLTSITTIDDHVSRVVRAQYEENPYPRWNSVSSSNTDTIEKLSRRLRPRHEVRVRPRPVQILVAGCGTGHHPIQVARAYPDSEILAVDLSLSSLAYASRMTEQFAISNITYRQADILKLGELDRRFSIVDSCGVLHHLDDPMAGWRVLVDLLEADGLMRIALYSEKARRAVRAAREFARSLKFSLSAQGIRDCRHAIIALPDDHPAKDVMTFGDFFTLDEFRDLILHVQEHQFTLPQIARCLDQLGLQFVSFECAIATRDRFREMFPDGNADVNLDAWHQFEESYPDTFKGMYPFWCCRK